MYEELVKRLRDPCQYENCVLCQEAADAIEDLEFACNRYEKDYKALCAYLPKWISVNERLPIVGDKVIVAIKDESGDSAFVYTYTGWYSGNGKKWIVDDDFNNYVTHWMPLPEPPKEETE